MHHGIACRPHHIRPSKAAHRSVVLFAFAVTAAGAAVIRRFPPTQYAVYPRCPIHAYLHFDCPGCGATRALAALLQGHPAEAFHCNALFVAVIPLLAGYAALSCYRAWTSDGFRWPEPPAWATCSLLAATAIFTIVRNLPA